MKSKLILFILSLFTTICVGQNEGFLTEKATILKNQYENLLKFSKVATVIDNDRESYWAYNYADSTITTIDNSGKSYYEDLNKIYTAYSCVFYGMSYTRTVMSIARGDNYSFEELNETIIRSPADTNISLSKLSNNELASIYSIINFYKVSRMPRFDDMEKMYQRFSANNKYYFENYTEQQAYKITSFNNKKLFFMIFAGLIIDIYKINNPSVADDTFKNYMQLILKQGEKMDEIPTDETEIINLNNHQYFKYIEKSSEVQKTMLNYLIEQIKILNQRNE